MKNQQDIIKAFETGMTCDEIDEKFNLEPGTAHDAIVAAWRRDSKRTDAHLQAQLRKLRKDN